MNRNVSIKQVILNDYSAFTAFLLPVIFAIAYGILIVRGEAAFAWFDLLLIFGALSVGCISVLFWRISVFKTVFDDGMETLASISSVWYFRDRIRISVIYTYQGQKFTNTSVVMKTKSNGSYRVGEVVVVLVDRSKPNRAFLRDLYVT